MPDLTNAIKSTIPISLFNRGLAGKIFDEVKKTGAKIVMKNNAPECVLMSPEDYVKLMDEINDARLLEIATERLANFDPEKLIPHDEFWREFNITEEELEAVGEVEFE